MLSFLKRNAGIACVSAALALSAQSAQAEIHTILIFDEGYFPEVTYVKPGDVVIFENASDLGQKVKARNNSWGLPDLGPGQSGELVITPNMHSTFLNPETAAFEGNFNYDDPPLD